ncbi:MAG TPA: hypothetical protein DDZ51_07055 [Planctomycetaceae bacterium]|nr:hypothetical protein [Planctomycetaceae bacterium]
MSNGTWLGLTALCQLAADDLFTDYENYKDLGRDRFDPLPNRLWLVFEIGMTRFAQTAEVGLPILHERSPVILIARMDCSPVLGSDWRMARNVHRVFATQA